MVDAEIDKIIERTVIKATKESDKRTQAHINALTKESDERMQQYIGAINEESKHNIEAVAEQYLGLNEKVDRIEATSNATFEEVGNMRVELTEHNEIMKNQEKRITTLEEKVR